VNSLCTARTWAPGALSRPKVSQFTPVCFPGEHRPAAAGAATAGRTRVRMSSRDALPFAFAEHAGANCLWLHTQRAARALMRRFDQALRPVGLRRVRFWLRIGRDRRAPASLAAVAAGLAMDRTTLTANLKPLARRGLVWVAVDAADRRLRRVGLTPAGQAVLAEAAPLGGRAHAATEPLVGSDPMTLRAALRALS